tara:strand:- start:534 stop:1658 length:1125 start_codon:yes stop_codon:yes gene_type:complete
MAGIGWEFGKVFNWDGVGTSSSDYADVTLEAQSPGGTSFTLFNSSAYYLYLGHSQKFDMAIFDVDTAGSLGALTWEYRKSDDTWVEFVPASGRFATDSDDNEGVPYAFDKTGAETFPSNLLDDWATLTINSANLYWIRVTAASVATAPTIKRIQCRPFAIYTTSKLVYELLQLKNVLNGTDFTSSTVPSKETVDFFINESQSYIDMNTRKSWRPNLIYDEHHQFNLNGIKLEMPDAQRVLQLKIWTGSTWELKAQGRQADYFLVPETGMVHFARYFLLPARLSSFGATQFGGGEFTHPVKITYLSGRDINTDITQAGIIQEACKKMVAIDVMRNADFGNAVVSGMDRVSMESRIQSWQTEIEDRLDFLTAFEVF